MRRRLDRQERVREALLLDLGAIVFELHRQRRREPELLQAKATELRTVDEEVRELADALGEDLGVPALTARGLVAACTGCGKLMGPRDRYCPSCGAAAGARAEDAPDEAERVEEPDFGDTIEAAAITSAEAGGGGHGEGPERAEAESPEAEPEPAMAPRAAEEPAHRANGARATRSSSAGTSPDSAVVLRVQRKMRAGRRMARQWLEQRRSEGP